MWLHDDPIENRDGCEPPEDETSDVCACGQLAVVYVLHPDGLIAKCVDCLLKENAA